MTEGEMVGWHHRCDGHEFEWVSGVGDGQGSLACFSPWDFPGKNTGVSCHALLQGIFPIQGSNLHLLSLLHWQLGSLPLVPPGGPCAHLGTLNTTTCSECFMFCYFWMARLIIFFLKIHRRQMNFIYAPADDFPFYTIAYVWD